MSEARKVRPRIVSFLVGQGLDLGCGPEKVVQDAIGIDYDRGGIKYDGKGYPQKLGGEASWNRQRAI